MDKVKIGFPIEYADENNIVRNGLFLREPEIKELEKRLKEINKTTDLKQQFKKQKEVIDKAIETLEKGITFCENDSQGIYNKCNIAINREKKVLNILKEVSE